MFNLSQHKEQNDDRFLENELVVFDIIKNLSGYDIKIGDEWRYFLLPEDCLRFVDEGLKELRTYIWHKWYELRDLADIILQSDSTNPGVLDNLLFLNNVKKIYLLGTQFTELDEISTFLRRLFDVDIATIPPKLIVQFNHLSLYVKLLHRLILRELYRKKIMNEYFSLHKMAQVSGPWANLDLPMSERIWKWDDGETEYFSNREKERKEQLRYNPEYLFSHDPSQTGYYFIWNDLTRGPYKFEDIKEESPYKHRYMLQIASKI